MVIPDLGLVMVQIPAGTFRMGASPEERGFRDIDTAPTTVRISRPFWLGKFEVTQREWRAIMKDNPSDFVGDLLPVDSVDWEMATEFCRRLTERERQAGRLKAGYVYALPTEAQWEYACRAGSTGPVGKLDDLGWYTGNSGSWAPSPGPASARTGEVWRMGTHPVGQKLPNAWGLYDMYGNVLEWCSDRYGQYPVGEVTDPAGAGTGSARVLRGGGWWTDPQVCNAFSRTKAPPNRHHSALGFRLALVPQP